MEKAYCPKCGKTLSKKDRGGWVGEVYWCGAHGYVSEKEAVFYERGGEER